MTVRHTFQDYSTLAAAQQDAQHELLRGALARVHMGDALDLDFGSHSGLI